MDDNWVGAKHQRLKSALTLFAQDGESRHLLYANTDIDREDESNEIVNFVNYWTDVKGIIEQTLVFDSKLTTYDILEDLDTRKIKFITFAKDLKRFEDCTPKTIFADFINCRCIGEVVGDEIIIKMKKKATREFALIGYPE